ncbi:hypothetical protein CR163_000140 [Prosthecochloris sp. ZM_2]|nr:hypothetical protein CR163_000140 [Prosthecochloris sp. ZM_2]
MAVDEQRSAAEFYFSERNVCSIRLFVRRRADKRMTDPRPRSPDRRASELLNNRRSFAASGAEGA